MDVYSSEILSYNISKHPTLDIVINPLKEFLNIRPNVNYRLTIHSDQGWRYQNKEYVNSLKEIIFFKIYLGKTISLIIPLWRTFSNY